MKVEIDGAVVHVEREPSDPRFYGKGWAPTHRLFYHVRNALRAQGLDVVKRRLSADGHLMGDDETPYIRERRGRWAIVDDNWQIRDAAQDFNRDGRVTLHRYELC